MPTVEEFEEILGCPLRGRKPYIFSRVVLFPNMDGLLDLAAIDAFLAYHHSKESMVVAILANAYDTFD